MLSVLSSQVPAPTGRVSKAIERSVEPWDVSEVSPRRSSIRLGHLITLVLLQFKCPDEAMESLVQCVIPSCRGFTLD